MKFVTNVCIRTCNSNITQILICGMSHPPVITKKVCMMNTSALWKLSPIKNPSGLKVYNQHFQLYPERNWKSKKISKQRTNTLIVVLLYLFGYHIWKWLKFPGTVTDCTTVITLRYSTIVHSFISCQVFPDNMIYWK